MYVNICNPNKLPICITNVNLQTLDFLIIEVWALAALPIPWSMSYKLLQRIHDILANFIIHFYKGISGIANTLGL